MPEPVTGVAPEEARAALDRLLASGTFERAHRLRELLAYVGGQVLRGDGARLNETLIAVEVFHREASGDDAIVRRQAHALRAKLLQYYATEGASEPVQIDLPVGTYAPTFRRRAEPQPRKGLRPRARVALMGAAGLGLFGAGVLVGRRRSESAHLEPALVALWAGWLDRREPVTFCFGNPMTATIRATERAGAGVRGMLLERGSEANRRFRTYFGLGEDKDLYVSPDNGQAKVGEGQAAVRLAAMFTRAGRGVRSTQSRYLTWDLLRREDVILFGDAEANAWADRLLEARPFRLRAHETDQGRAIVDTRPGGAAFHNRRGDPDEHHALISFLPGLAPRRTLVLLSGLSSAATDLAAELLTEPSGAAALLSKVRAAGSTGHFQAVVRGHVRQDVPMRAEVVAVVSI